MIRGARGDMGCSWLGLIWPGLAPIAMVLIFNALCDALRDVLDPRARPMRLGPAMLPAAAVPPMAEGALLQVDDLSTHIRTPTGLLRAVDRVSLAIAPGETLAILGESGSVKSMTGLCLTGLAPAPAGRITGGSVRLRRRSGAVVDIAQAGKATLETIRGDEVAMIVREPMTALNPVSRIGDQIAEAVMRHRAMDLRAASALAVETLDRVGVPVPALRARAYPHELSGGLRQRAMIAMALALSPRRIIADEPTTALDVTIQAQILDLLRRLLAESDPRPALIFITHDLGVVSEPADRVMVLYLGRVMERAPVDRLCAAPRHPHNRALLYAAPQIGGARPDRILLTREQPSPANPPSGCVFRTRCPRAMADCARTAPPLTEIAPGHFKACPRRDLSAGYPPLGNPPLRGRALHGLHPPGRRLLPGRRTPA